MTIARTNQRMALGLPAVAALCACALVPAAQAATQPSPASGWHGREIRDPRNDARRVVVPQRPASVQEAQRLLSQLGYRPGPVDGVLGPRTRSSVQWFQMKHGLTPRGALDDATVAHMRLRVHTGGPVLEDQPAAAAPAAPAAARPSTAPAAPAAARPSTAPAAPAAARPTAAPALTRPLPALRHTPQPAPRAAERAPSDDTATGPPVGLLGVALAALAAVALALTALTRRRRRPRPAPAPRPRPADAGGSPGRLAAAPLRPAPAEAVTAVGYARGRDKAELDRHSAAIRRACSERGWTLGRLVREGAAGPRRPGLVHALRHVAEGDGAPARLVVDQVEHLGTTPAELAARLAWCSRNNVDVVALDVGLDTGTREGRTAARCLLAVSSRERPAATSRGRGARPATQHAGASGAPARASTAER